MAASDSARARCLVVAAGLTVAAWGAATVLAGLLMAPGEPLVRLCLVALLASVGWGWLQGLAAVLEAWRGATRSPPSGAVRRVVLAACGVAVVGVLAARPADAAPDRPDRADALSGLPLPQRAVGPARTARPAVRVVAVRRGDSLWALAAADLAPGASADVITEGWQLIYRRNRGVIGADPDQIRPGQLLRLPHLTTKEPT